MLDLSRVTSADEKKTAADLVRAALLAVHAKLIRLIADRCQQPEVMAQVTSTREQTHSLQSAPRANLDAMARGNNASQLVTALSDTITAWEQASGRRKNIRRKSLENLK